MNLAVQVSAAVAAAKAKAEREADDKFQRDADALVRATMAGDAKRAAAQAARGPEAPLRPLAEARAPVPLPETAENVDFNGTDGRLEFDSSASIKALAAFYRAAMKPLGWKEQPSVINGPNLIELDFAKGGKELTFTVMQLGTKANVRANGSGLVAAGAKPDVADNQPGASAKATGQALEADEDSGLPVPKQHTLSTAGTTTMPGGQSPFRRALNASVPAELGAVLAFYRSELAKRDWKETGQGAVVKPDRVVLAFSSPEGPAVLKLGRQGGETTVDLALKNSGRRRQGRHAAGAGSSQAHVRQYGRYRRRHHDQRQDHQDRGRSWRSYGTEWPHARIAAGKVQILPADRGPARARQRAHGRRRRYLGPHGGARRDRGDAAANVLMGLRPDRNTAAAGAGALLAAKSRS